MRWTRYLGVLLGVVLVAPFGKTATAAERVRSESPLSPEHAAIDRSGETHLAGLLGLHQSGKQRALHRRRGAEIGVASWYGNEWHGRRTASGERFRSEEMTAAHPTLPLRSRALVTNMANGKSVAVRITDRGPHTKGRIIDVSHSAAERLGMLTTGVARVRVEPLSSAKEPEAAAVSGDDATIE